MNRFGVLIGLLTPLLAQAGEPVLLVPRISATIDRHLAADWKANGITPAAPATDAEFCRRVYLDVLGRIPKSSELRTFCDLKADDKRAKLVEQLLQRPGFASHQAAAFRTQWLPETLSDIFKIGYGEQVESWLRKRLAQHVPFDHIVKDVLTASVTVGPRGLMFNRQQSDTDQFALESFYQALDAKPEQLGATVSRAFLGVKLECAQCHDHPFAPIKRDEFWKFAALFAELTPAPRAASNFIGPLEPQYTKNTLTIPGLDRSVKARFADGTEPKWNYRRSPREELAVWMTAPNNPFFARNFVNRIWHQYFGIGILDPIDEPGEANPPSHPKLLDELARLFIESKFDLTILIRGITASQAYQLSSKQSHDSQAKPRHFARMSVKGLTGAQIYENFVTATGLKQKEQGRYFDPGTTMPSKYNYKMLYPSPAKPTETDTSILQALTVMNGKLVVEQTSLDKSETLAAIADAPFLTTEKKVEALFIAAFARTPTTAESETFSSYVERGGPSGNRNRALADVFWVLLNSTEFLFNH